LPDRLNLASSTHSARMVGAGELAAIRAGRLAVLVPRIGIGPGPWRVCVVSDRAEYHE
jgi:hypothetical protein